MKNNVVKRVLALLLTLAMLLPYMGELMPVMQVNAATTTYGEANVYDIYDLTGSKTNTIKGTNDTWDGQIHANVSAEHKENIVFKTKLTMGEQEIRLSLNALDGASIYDPSGYSVWINHNGGAPYIAVKRNMQDLVVGSPASVAGTWELEIGIVDILTDGVRTGKHLYVKKDGVIVCEADDTNDYLTGDALGTKIIDFHYGAAIQMDTTYETTYGEANVYDIYDLTGSRENTIKGTDESWDGQIRADVSAEHKENFAFKTKLTMSTQNVRLSLTAKDGDDIFDPPGYAVYLYGADNKVEIRRNNSALKDATVESLAGTYTFEVGIVDILFGGNRVGKHLYVKINDVVVCEVDDTDGYLTGDALGTKIIDFHYGAAIQMDTAYEGGYGTANVYDIWYLTDSTAMSVNAWASTKIGSVAEAHKEQAAIKMSMNITDARHRYRFSVGAEEGVDCTDPHGYGLEIAVQFDDSNYVKFTRGGGSQIAIFDDVSGVIGEHDLEFGYRNILLNGNVIGKQVYLSVDGNVLYTYEDLSGYLTGETLGTMVALHHIDDAAVQLNSTYGVITNGTANVYDIYDLTGSETNTLKGTDETWDGQIHANVSAEHKENIAFKTKLTMGAQEIRLSLNALDGASITDPSGYAVYINHNNGAPYISIRRNNSDLVVGSVASVAGTWVLEIGIVDVLSDGNRIGKHLYVKKDGEIVCEVDDMNGYLTGDTLGTKIVDFHYGAAIQMDTTYKSGYGEANVYDIYDLTGSKTNTLKGTDETYDGQIHANVSAEHKENIVFKTKLTMGEQEIRLSLNALDGASIFDPSGYSVFINHNGGAPYIAIKRNMTDLVVGSVASVAGTWELEIGIVDILTGGVRTGKHLYVKMDGVTVCEVDDTDGYLTGDALGTKIIDFHYGAAIQMDTTYESGYGEANVYDIYDLTGSKENTFNGTGNGNWSASVMGNIAAADKESVSFKANVSITDEAKYRFSLGALDADDCVDPAGYGFELVIGTSGYVRFQRGSSHTEIAKWDVDTTNLKGEYELEFGYRDITFNGNVIGKQIFLKKDGEVLYSYDDVEGYLTGEALGTKVAIFHYGTAVQMDSTLSFFVHSYNLTLGGSTVMNLRLDPAEINDSAATVTVSVGGTTKTYTLKELPIDADGLHRVSVPLAAPQMKDEVILTVTRSDGETMTKSFTIAGYASYIYNGNYSAAQKAAVEAMLHYGAAAQTYFEYNVDNLANEGYTDSVNNTISNAYATEMTGAVSDVAIYGSSLVLGKNITLRHYLNITGDVSDYSFIFNGVEVTPYSTSVDGANYFVQLDGILPNALDGVYVLRISKGSEAMEYKYCPMSYVERMHGKEQLADLMQELYDYHVAVKALAAANVTDSATVLDLYQISGETSVTIPVGEVLPLGVLVGAEDSFVKKELTSNVAIRFKYTGGEGMRFQLGASLQEISYTSGALFVSVPDNNSFGIYKLDQSGWMQDSSGNDLFSWQSCLGRDQTSYIELGCVKRYTNGVYTHDRYYVRAAASLAELELMAQNGTYSVYYDTTMKDNNGYSVIVRSRMDNGGDVLATTWTEEQIAAYEEKQNSAAQGLTSDNYDALDAKYPEKETNNSNTAAGLAAAKNPDTTASTGGDELILWAESGTAKIVQDDDGKAATLANTKNALSIQMAKNEDEGAQLMLFGNRNVTSYEVFVTDLVSGSNRISAENIRLYQLKYLTVDDKSSGGYDTPSAYAGEKLPDAMLPFAKAVEYGENTILAGNNQAIYVDVSTKSTDAAGTYTGTIVVKTASHVYTLPISVVVQNVVMPENSQLGTYAPYLGRDSFTSGELDGSDEMASLYVQTLQDFNMSSIIPESDDVLNIEKFLVNVRRNYDNLTNYMLPVDFSDSYYTVGGAQTAVYCNYALMKEYVVALAKMSIADGKNYLDKAFFYPSDHADESKTEAEFNIAKATYKAFCQMLDDADAELTATYSGSSKYTAAIQNSVKNLRFLLTVPGDDDSGKSLDIGQLLTDFLGSANRKNVVLCTSNEVLVRDGYGEDVASAMNGAYADELWTYLCLKPYYPYSNYAFDTPVVGLRTLGWTCYQENVSTLMTWKSVDYLYGPDGLSLDRWTTSSAGTSMVTPGDGNVFYPGAKYGIDGPCPSLRAIAWRDGVDDYNLMNMVVANGGSAANLNTLYGLITKTYKDSIKASSETGSWFGSLISKNVNATVPIDDDAKFAIVRNALLQMAASATSEHAAIISNAQSAVNAVVAATGTTNALENAGSENTATINGNVYNSDGSYQLADFESYAETVQNKFSGNAQLSLIGSAQNGSYSLKVAVQPGQKGETVWIPTTSKYFSATTNFSGATKITFKVYNAQASDSTVRFYLNTYDRSGDVYNAGTYYKGDSDIWHDDHPNNTSYRFTLTPGWNTITIDGALPSYVGAFVIAFDSGAGYDTQQVFYLDDVRVYMSKVG